jgi:acid phosphatase
MKNKFISSALIFLMIIAFENCNKQENVQPSSLQNQSASDLTSFTLPKPDHIVIVFEENHSFKQIIGSVQAPYINSLANDSMSVLFTESYAVTHPSQPNYICFYSGADQGVLNDNRPTNIPFITPNLGYQLIAAGYSFATYSQDLPYMGFDGDTNRAYVRRHNPAVNWIGTGINQIPRSVNMPFSKFPTDYTQLPTVSLVIPDVANDMHDDSINKGDKWLQINMKPYVKWARTHNSLFILTFDEDNRKDSNHIATIFCGPMIRSGSDIIPINHYRVLRTIEEMYGLPYTGNAANVKTIYNCFRK